MARKRYSDEDALKVLREIDIHLHDGLDVLSACCKAEGLTIDRLRQAVIHTRQKLNTSERRTCAVLSVSHSSLHYNAKFQDNVALRLAMIRLAKQHGRYSYRKIAGLLRIEGWRVNHKKVERLWHE